MTSNGIEALKKAMAGNGIIETFGYADPSNYYLLTHSYLWLK